MPRRFHLLIFALLLAGLVSAEALGEPQTYDLVSMKRKYFANCLWDSGRARIGGQEVEGTLAGLGGTEDAVMAYDLEGRYEMLEVLAGYLDSAPDNRSSVFEVWADGEILQRVGPLHSGQEPEWVRVPLKDRRILTLRIVPQGYDDTHGAVWGSPKLWAGLEGQIPGSILLKVGGHTTPVIPSVRGKQKELPVPLPLEPGVREYRVRLQYDEETGKAEAQITPADGNGPEESGSGS